ncbi:Essential protein Yae1, N terminal [Teratosphaeria destructans]|uniref:Essential protein Yae1, N terminal n=1 Tax=Teratosphaeria destructans TaxID=418781 RepID=A0A9W7SWI1_9PEZI|nr:Essential protein Yae1, N terminal [Teratosphaeria destructans]
MDAAALPSSPSHRDPDPFATLLTLEDTYFTEGYTLGLRDGTRAGRIEGRVFGLEKGFTKAVEMGRLHGRAKVWHARLSPPTSALGHGVKALKGGERLKRHVERLTELTDPESLECKNGEDEVNEFDERLAGAKAKFTLIERIAGEGDRDGDRAGASSSPARSPSSAAVTTGSVAEGQEVEITSVTLAALRPPRAEASVRQTTDATESSFGVSRAAAARRAAPEF